MGYKNFPPLRRKKRVLRKKPRRPSSVREADPSASNPMHAYRLAFSEWTLAKGLTRDTARTRDHAIIYFIRWADERGIAHVQDVTRAILERYQRSLFLYRKADGEPLTFSSQQSRLNPLRSFFKWLAAEHHILYNPAAELVLPKAPSRLPKVLSVADVDRLMNETDIEEPAGLRDRAILETLYSTGLRRMELVHLKLYDIDLRQGMVTVREGKGRKDRLVPIGARACAWLHRYIEEVRPSLSLRMDELAVFLTDYGEPFERNRLGDLVKRYMRHAGVAQGSCHLLRHACATHMLENGADMRFIQVLLGHSSITSTEIYASVSIAKLKEIHAATHPARMERAKAE